ncbi:MAG TPA: molybdenum cofactor guanylyltransferase [Lysobacter sp.]|nr:molybdenum cofactor guanylyltransferase [Lysobacter sp.]
MERGLLAVPRGLSFTGIVLAGGRSSRMGRDKALLEIDGRTLLDRAIALLRDAGAAEVLVSGDRPGGIPDMIPGLGPVGGIASVLSRVDDGPFMVMPVDMPALDVDTLHLLLDATTRAPAAHFERHPLPWAARIDAARRERISELMAESRGPSMRALHAAWGGIELPAPRPALLRNVNAPADWAEFA